MWGLAVVFLFATASTLGVPESNDTRVVGGQKASKGQFPYIISLRVGSGQICAGSIIKANKIVTAAHCVYNNQNPLYIVAGITLLTDPGQQRTVSKFVTHPNYVPSDVLYDVAVLTLSSNLVFSNVVKSIPIRKQTVTDGESLTLAGWGLTSYPGSASYDLMFVKLKGLKLSSCKEQLKDAPAKVREGNVCSTAPAGKGACYGDSGGPLVDSSTRLVGIVSWGTPCAVGKPDVYASPGYYYDWIMAQ